MNEIDAESDKYILSKLAAERKEEIARQEAIVREHELTIKFVQEQEKEIAVRKEIAESDANLANTRLKELQNKPQEKLTEKEKKEIELLEDQTQQLDLTREQLTEQEEDIAELKATAESALKSEATKLDYLREQYKNYIAEPKAKEEKIIGLKPIDEQSANIGKQTNPKNYITANRFYVEMDSTLTASFSECSGFGVNLKKEAYLEGGVNDQQRIVVGHAEFDDITLKRGMSDNQTFWDWILKNFNNPQKERRNVNIVLFNQAGETMQSWTLIGSIPISWKAPAFQADGSSVAIEELTLAYEGLQVNILGGGGASIGVTRDVAGYFPTY